jgi:hypothetical protein
LTHDRRCRRAAAELAAAKKSIEAMILGKVGKE